MRTLFTLTCAILLSVSAARAASAAVTGSLVDENGAPVAAADVRLYAPESRSALAARIATGKFEREPLASAKSREDGSFSVNAPSGVAFDLAATAPAHQAIDLEVVDGDALGGLLMRSAKPRRGRVLAAGKPVAGAFITGPGATSTRSASDGTFEVPEPSTRAALVHVFHPDFAPATEALRSARPVDVKLAPGVTLRGRVVAADGSTPAARASVVAGRSGNPLVSTLTAEDGSFVLAHVPPRWRTLTVSSDAGAAFFSAEGKLPAELRLRAPATLTGSVRDAKSRSVVPGVRLLIRDAIAVSDAKGSFSFTGLPASEYMLFATHPSYQIGEVTVPLNAGQRESRALAAAPLAKISGVVFGEERKPVAAALVARVTRMGISDREALTNAKGEFVYRAAAPRLSMRRDVELRVTKKGYAGTTRSVAVDEGEVKTGVAITLKRGFPLEVSVRDRDRQPVAGADVSLRAADGDDQQGWQPPQEECELTDCVTDARGVLTFRIATGKYNVRVTGDQVVAKLLPGEQLGPKSSPLAITVDRGVEVSGRVVSHDGTPVSGAAVWIGETPTRDVTDAAGTFAFHNAPRGTVRIQSMLPTPFNYLLPAREVTAPAKDVVITVPRTGSISGRVIDAESSQPITDFRLLLRLQTPGSLTALPIHSDDGTFTADGLPPGRLDVTAMAADYAAGNAAGITVEEGKATPNVEVRLSRGGHLRGRVTADGAAVSGAVVRVSDESSRVPFAASRAATDANGDYDLNSIPAGERTIVFEREGYVRAEKRVDAPAGKETRLDVALERGNMIRGRVVDETGRAVAGADVRVQANETSGTRTDEDGKFEIGGVRENKVGVVAQKQGYVPARADDVDATSPASIALTLSRGGTVTGRVSGLPQEELGGLMVSVRSAGPGGYARGATDASGSFSISGVADGRATVEAYKNSSRGSRSARKEVDVVNGSASPVDLVFGTGSTISGRVTLRGQPVEEGFVAFNARGRSNAGGSARIAAGGTYTVEGLEPLQYDVSVMSMGSGNLFSGRYTVTGSSVYDIDIPGLALRGTVTDANTGAPLSGAQVMPNPTGKREPGAVMYGVRPALTDSTGRFVFDAMQPGQWVVRVQKESYQNASQEVTVAEGTPEVRVQMVAATAARVRVIDAQTGEPLVATVVAVAAGGKGISGSDRSTAGDGVAQLWLAPGRYTLRVSARDYAAGEGTLDVPGSEVTVRMTHGARVVVLQRGQAAAVRARLVAAPPAKLTVNTSNGTFNNVPPGQYTVRIIGPEGKPAAEKPVTVVAGQTATVNFE